MSERAMVQQSVLQFSDPCFFVGENCPCKTFQRTLELGMPQMVPWSLSENWLYRELGALHWEFLSVRLGRPISELASPEGDRVYSTFARVKLVGRSGLAAVEEGDTIHIRGCLARVGQNKAFSRWKIEVNSSTFRVAMLSVFVTRGEQGNLHLTRAIPQGMGCVPEAAVARDFCRQCGRLHSNVAHKDERSIAERKYAINPYYDMNGVNLLYFAAYPSISDFCEHSIFSPRLPPGESWASFAATTDRDICYFANCNSDDAILLRLHKLKQNGRQVQLRSSLSRRADGRCIAEIHTTKVLNQMLNLSPAD